MNVAITPFKHHFIPPATGEPSSLLLLVHGRTGNLRLLEWYAKRFQIPNLGFLSIEAPYPEKRPEQVEPGFSWFLGEFEGIEKTRESLRKMLGEIIDQGFPSKRIFWLGFSQGAAMGLDVALRSDLLLGGFVCVSGFPIRPDEFPAAFGPFAKQQRLLITHGTRDSIIAFDRVEKGYQKLRDLGVPMEFLTFDKPHSFHLKKEVPLLQERLLGWIQEP